MGQCLIVVDQRTFAICMDLGAGCLKWCSHCRVASISTSTGRPDEVLYPSLIADNHCKWAWANWIAIEYGMAGIIYACILLMPYYIARFGRLFCITLLWRHNGRDGVSNHQPHDCLLNRLFMHRSKKTSKLRVTGLCVGNSPVTGKFPAQMASNAENVSIWWRHHGHYMIQSHSRHRADHNVGHDISMV